MRERNTLWHPAFGTVIVYLAIQFACVTLLSYSSSLFVNIIAEDLNAAVGTTQLRTVPGSIVAVLMLPFANKIYNKIGFKFSICLGVCSYCLAFVGIRNEAVGSGGLHHNPLFDIDEEVLPACTALHIQVALDTLQSEGELT